MWQVIFIQVVTFILIIIFLRVLFHKNLSSALKRLQDLHGQNLEKEATLNREIERAKKDREEETEKGRWEAKKLIETAKTEADKLKEEALLRAKQEAEKAIEETRQECESIRRKSASEIEESSVKLASAIIREIFSEEARQELQRELVDELVVELRKIDKEKLKVEIKKAEVITSHPLLEKQKSSIAQIICEAVGHHVELEEKIDASIISGLVINLGGRILDGSLQNKLRKVIPYIKRDGPLNFTL